VVRKNTYNGGDTWKVLVPPKVIPLDTYTRATLDSGDPHSHTITSPSDEPSPEQVSFSVLIGDQFDVLWTFPGVVYGDWTMRLKAKAIGDDGDMEISSVAMVYPNGSITTKTLTESEKAGMTVKVDEFSASVGYRASEETVWQFTKVHVVDPKGSLRWESEIVDVADGLPAPVGFSPVGTLLSLDGDDWD
jgi:hypothetical protein